MSVDENDNRPKTSAVEKYAALEQEPREDTTPEQIGPFYGREREVR